MREINVSQITDVVERLCIEANTHLPGDVKCAIRDCRACEDWDIAKGVLDNIITNFEIVVVFFYTKFSFNSGFRNSSFQQFKKI